MADREGFEPSIRLPVCRISSAVLSTAQPPVRRGRTIWSALAPASGRVGSSVTRKAIGGIDLGLACKPFDVPFRRVVATERGCQGLKRFAHLHVKAIGWIDDQKARLAQPSLGVRAYIEFEA